MQGTLFVCQCLHTFWALVPVCTQKSSPVTTPLFTLLCLVFRFALLPVLYEVLLCHIWGQITLRHCCTVGLPNQIPHHQNRHWKHAHKNRSSGSSLIQIIVKSTYTLKTSLSIMCLWIIWLPGTPNARNGGRLVTWPWLFLILYSVLCCLWIRCDGAIVALYVIPQLTGHCWNVTVLCVQQTYLPCIKATQL
jgi:hypothetical protein